MSEASFRYVFAATLFSASLFYNVYGTLVRYPDLSLWFLLGDVIVAALVPVAFLVLTKGPRHD